MHGYTIRLGHRPRHRFPEACAGCGEEGRFRRLAIRSPRFTSRKAFDPHGVVGVKARVDVPLCPTCRRKQVVVGRWRHVLAALLIFPGMVLLGAGLDAEQVRLVFGLTGVGLALLLIALLFETRGPAPPVDLEAQHSHLIFTVGDPEVAVAVAELNHGCLLPEARRRRYGAATHQSS